MGWSLIDDRIKVVEGFERSKNGYAAIAFTGSLDGMIQ